jgi:hypothetical protein
MHRLAFVISFIPSLAACGGTDDPEPAPPFDYCAEQHRDGGTVVCDRAFPDHPRVHLPPDTIGADGAPITIYAAFDPIDDRALILRDGTRRVLADAAGAIRPLAAADTGRVPDGFGWPSYEFLETVYELTGTAAHDGDAAAIRDANVRPIVRIPPEVLDGVIAGGWEGTLSRRTGPNKYDPAQRVAIRVAWSGYESDRQVIPHWEDGELSYALVATGAIANATAAVTAADGTCLPALSSLGDANPILELGAAATMLRMPSMHGVGDYQLVWNGGMGSILPAHPAAAIQDAARDQFLVTSIYPHGTPNGMHLDGFRAVTGGGAACAP